MLDKMRQERKAKKESLDAILNKSDASAEERAAADALITEISELDARMDRVAELEAREAAAASMVAEDAPAQEVRGVAHVTREERTYSARANVAEGRSFFSDAFNARVGDVSARERIERHMREAAVEGELNTRATTTSSYAGLVVPQYLVDMAAQVSRAGRPMADNGCTKMDLPAGGMSLIIPRATTGVSVASQASENSAVSNTDQVWTNVTVPVATISGRQEVSRQSLERGTPGIDGLIYADLAAAYAAELDRQIFVGTGASGQMSGIGGTAGISTATAFGAAVAASTFYSKIAGQIAAIAGAGTATRPSHIVMHPRRWAWLTLQVDSAGRPLVVPAIGNPMNAHGNVSVPGGYSGDQGVGIVGYFQGLPVITDSNVPTNVGGGTSEDVVYVFDKRHALLFEDGAAPRNLRFDETKGDALTVVLAAYNYAAFTAGRYPSAFGRVGGADSTGANGLQAPSF